VCLFKKNEIEAKNRERVNSIAFLQVNEPHGENVVNLGGGAVAFGLVGGLVQAGINVSHSNTYTQKVAEQKILFAPLASDGIISRLTTDGYQVVKLTD
jgi:hypothetical protein